jgi:hypothetical protein
LDGTFDASVINVINLIAEKVLSTSGASELSVSGAELSMTYEDFETVHVYNDYGRVPKMQLKGYFSNTGEVASVLDLNPDLIEVGGAGLDDRAHIGVDHIGGTQYKAYIVLPGSQRKKMYISWKDNGDGTKTLIGTEG